VKKIILIGGGGHCLSCIDVIESIKNFQIQGIVQPNLENLNLISGYPVIGTDKDLPKLLKKIPNVLICVGQIKTSKVRTNLFNFLKQNGAIFPIIKSPNSYCSPRANISEGTIVMHGCIINSNVVVGSNCILNTKSLIEHDVIINKNCHISTGAIINGGVSIGEGTFIGSGSVIKEGVKIGNKVIIGAGQVIHKNISDEKIIK